VRQPIPFGKYVLLERISVGGMAEVFKAKSFGVEGFEKILAIKRILPSLAEDTDFIEMFIDEAKICGQLNHANICQIFELGRVDDSHFIAMEYVWGKDLLQIQNRMRKQRTTMRPEMAAFIAAKLCEGLDYAHKKKDATGRALNIIHRDISPQNILISYEGELKVIDFGIAKAASRSSKTQAGVLKGKFGYMSPEQVRGLPLDRRSDVFAIGTILYELLTADRLFVGESDFETLEKVRNVSCPPVSKVNPKVPASLEAIITKGLARDVDDRYQWANEMMEDLQSFLMGYEPVFTAKGLSQWMREAFALEMKREQEILDEQRRVGKEVLTASVAASFGAAARPVAAKPLDDFSGGSTNMLDDGDLAALVTDDQPDDDEFGEKTTVSESHGFEAPVAMLAQPLPEQKTAILSDAQAQQVPRASSPAGGSNGELPAQPTVILGDSGAPPPVVAPLRSGPEAKTLLPGDLMAPVVVSPTPTPRTGQVVSPLPYAPARSTLWKDILIGVGVAAALVGGVLGVRAYMGKGARGTLVVMANPARAADVLVDGVTRGHLDEGKPLTLKDLTAGSHAVVVRGADGAEFRQDVALAAGDVSVLSAALKQPEAAPVGTGTLHLNVKEPDGVQVEVDGAQLADGAWKHPIPLRADVSHEVRVTKPGREEAKLAVSLRAGEDATRDVDLPAGLGKLKVVSDPDGAEVNVNGKRVGVTPAQVGDLDTTKSVRVTVRHKGFAPVTKYVTFEKGLDQSLDLKLVASADDGVADEPKEAAAPKETAGPKELKAKPAGALLADISVPEPKKTAPAPAKEKAEKDDLAPVKAAAEKPKAKEKDPPAHEAKAAPPSSEPGFLVANTQPWAKVLIDGKDTGKTTPIAPRSKIPLKPGKHVVTFVVSGKKYNFDVLIKPGEDARLIKQLADTP
jgi:serine/threonine protein kinase